MDKTKIKVTQDSDGHFYWIPLDEVEEFENEVEAMSGLDYMDDPDRFDDFIEKYDKYRTLGAPDVTPEFFNKNNNE